MRMLVISNSPAKTSGLVSGFREAGFSLDHALESEQGSYWARTTEYDFILIDDGPKTDANLICKSIRDRGKTIPIMVVADDPITKNKVSLFEAGVDDCVDKKCSIQELTARVRAILRRPKELLREQLELDDLVLDISRCTVTRGKKKINLTKKEFGLLEYMMRNPDRVISRATLIEHVWDIHADLFSNTLETHILNLRRKIEVPNKKRLLHTISGRGYKMTLNP